MEKFNIILYPDGTFTISIHNKEDCFERDFTKVNRIFIATSETTISDISMWMAGNYSSTKKIVEVL